MKEIFFSRISQILPYLILFLAPLVVIIVFTADNRFMKYYLLFWLPLVTLLMSLAKGGKVFLRSLLIIAAPIFYIFSFDRIDDIFNLKHKTIGASLISLPLASVLAISVNAFSDFFRSGKN